MQLGSLRVNLDLNVQAGKISPRYENVAMLLLDL